MSDRPWEVAGTRPHTPEETELVKSIPMVALQRKQPGEEPRNKQWFATIVVDIYAPDIFKAHREAEVVASRMGVTFGIVKMSDRLQDDDDDDPFNKEFHHAE